MMKRLDELDHPIRDVFALVVGEKVIRAERKGNDASGTNPFKQLVAIYALDMFVNELIMVTRLRKDTTPL